MHDMTGAGAPEIVTQREPRRDSEHAAAVVYAGAVGDRVAYVVSTPTVIAHVYDPATDRWQDMTGGTAPDASERVWPIVAGHRLVLAWQGGPDASAIHIEALDLDASTLREVPAGPPTFNAIAEILGGALYVWPGTVRNTYPSPIGAWGALRPVEHPACPPGAPCVKWPDEYTASSVGSVIRW